jgi:prepilin-type N-terminal cleavage/methylation domain-containing protein
MTPRRRSPRRPRRGFTLTELLMAVSISTIVAGLIMSVMLYVMRTQATVATASVTRYRGKSAVDQMIDDIRNTSAALYNEPTWPKVVANPFTANVQTLTLPDVNFGRVIIWRYNRTARTLTRTIENWETGAPVTNPAADPRDNPDVLDYSAELGANIVDLVWTENSFNEFVPPAPEDWVTGGVQTLPSGTYPRITSVNMRVRTVMNLSPNNTAFREVDGNNDGSFLDDDVGAAVFGRTNRGDNPGWQFVINTNIAFRNTS